MVILARPIGQRAQNQQLLQPYLISVLMQRCDLAAVMVWRATSALQSRLIAVTRRLTAAAAA